MLLLAACSEQKSTTTTHESTTVVETKVAEPAKPPSTGAEMPVTPALGPEQARATVAELVTAAGQPSPACDRIADGLMVALPVAYPEVTAESAPAYQALQRCALATKRWRAAVQAGVALLAVQGDKFTVAQIVRALAEMGEYDKALAAAQELATRFPAAEESLIGALTFTYCKAERWEACLKTAEAALAHFTKQGAAPDSEGLIINRLFRDMAWVVLGEPARARADLEQLADKLPSPPPWMTALLVEARRAEERGFYLEVVPLPQLPTGVYHLMGRGEAGALVTLKLVEHAGVARSFRVEAEVPGVTNRSSQTLVVPAGAPARMFVNPPLTMDFDPAKIRSPRPGQLAIKIVEQTGGTERSIIDETVAIEVLPRDYLPLRRRVGADVLLPTYGYMGAWITSNDRAVETFLTAAKARVAQRQFVGEQGPTVPQLQALYDELKARGVSYVMDPDVTSDQAFVQRTRLPAEVLASTNAQCLEGTLLFATLMEAIGIRPIIVLVPGHAFVGWHTIAADGTKGEPLFVETTMVGGAPFDQAVKVATRRVQQELAAGSFKTGAATLIDVAAIRKEGFTAQPF
jgi:tetratricopeptide (TPR) repeat protein